MNKYIFGALLFPGLAYAASGEKDWLTQLVIVVISTMVFFGFLGAMFLIRGFRRDTKILNDTSLEEIRIRKAVKYFNIFLGIFSLGMLALFMSGNVTWVTLVVFWMVILAGSVLELKKAELQEDARKRLGTKIYAWTVGALSVAGLMYTIVFHFK